MDGGTRSLGAWGGPHWAPEGTGGPRVLPPAHPTGLAEHPQIALAVLAQGTEPPPRLDTQHPGPRGLTRPRGKAAPGSAAQGWLCRGVHPSSSPLKRPPALASSAGTILSTLPGGHGHILGSCEPAGAKMPPLVGSRAPRGSQRDHCMGLAVPGGALCHGARLPGGPGRALWVRGLRVGTLRVPRGAQLLHTAARSLRAAGGGNRRGAGGCTRAGAAAMESPR